MPHIRAWFSRFAGLFQKNRREKEMSEELEQHLDLLVERNKAAGMSPRAARTAAVREFGGVEQIKETAREQRVWRWADEFLQDLRFGFRALRKSPGFTLVVVATLALGIGATTAIFSIVDATLLQPLPYRQADQLVSVQDDLPGAGAHDIGMSQPEWEDLQHSGIFEYVSPAWFDENNLTGSSQPARVRLLITAPNYFALLGVQPRLGRAFNSEDHSPGIIPEVLISDGLWKRVFGSDPNILNKNVRMDTDLYRIVGVMPAGFDAPGRTAEERNIEIWAATSFYGAPMADHPARNRRNLPTAIARLKPGLSLAAAQSQLDAVVAIWQKQFPGDYPQQSGWRVRLLPLKERVVGNVRQSLYLLLGAVGLVLLIACVNVTNLLLARASVRGPEMALRQALGAGRGRLIRQLLTESLLLSLLGGAAGLAILLGIKNSLLPLVPENLPRLNEISISWAVLLFALVISVLAGLIFGLAPAFQTGRLDLNHALKVEGRGSSGSGKQARTRRGLVITEFALSLVLMIAASLLLRSFWDLLNVRLGFNPLSVMTVRTRLPDPNNPATDKYGTASQEAPFLRELSRRCAMLPGVEEVAFGDTASIPLDESLRDLKQISEGQFLLTLEGRDIQSSLPSAVERSSVSSKYFHLLGMTLLRGRLFNEADNDNTPRVAVINEAMAKAYWPNDDPLGKRFKSTRADSPWITVIGVLANARTQSLTREDVPQVYLDVYQTGAKRLAVHLRGHLNPASIPDEVREQVQALDPTLPVYGAQALNQTVSASLSQRRFSMEVVALFAFTALLLAGLGIHGMISYMVNERTHEIGIRLALGAQRQTILRMVVRQGLRLAITGAAVGLVGALIVSQLMTGLLYGVRPTDPMTFAGVAILLLLVALFACYVPARRAIRIDPMVALRHE
ncbi:MAG: ADOP family duplicated permease [Chthoniobacterales bacterium]